MNIVAASYIAVVTMGLSILSFPVGDVGSGNAKKDRPAAALDTASLLVEAGRILFHAQELSKDGELACGTCHIPAQHFQDGFQTGLARYRKLSRNTPTLLNVNRYKSFFWDGRANTLHDQITEPLIKSQVEMMSNDSIMASYVRSVGLLDSTQRILGYHEADTRTFVIGALERYLFSIATERTRYHDHLAGTTKLNASELRGLSLFNSKARCGSCHPAPDFTDNQYHDNGLSRQRSIVESYRENGVVKTRLGMDYGRGNIVTGKQGLFRFRTPSLYNVELTAPYMHNGSMATLEAVIDFYDRGGDEPLAGAERLDLTKEEKQDLLAFLKTLTDVRYATPATGSTKVSTR